MPQPDSALLQRVTSFLRHPETERFDSLAREVFAYQWSRVPAFRQYCDARRTLPDSVKSWRQIPLVPTLSFKDLEFATDPPVERFESSGTRQSAGTTSQPSRHLQPFPELYREVIDQTFPAACWPAAAPPPCLSLIPDRKMAPQSSLAFLVDHVLQHHATEDSAYAVGAKGVRPAAARQFLAARQRDNRPTLLLATTLALLELLEGLERLDLRFRLPAGSRLFETGGWKTRAGTVDRADMAGRIVERLALAEGSVVHEYGMTELTSHFYALPRSTTAEPLIYRAPPWTRVRILHPETLDDQPAGEVGMVAVWDLANAGSVLGVLTEDLGVARDETTQSFEWVGRAAGAELRGCSLLSEQLRH